MSGIVLGTVDVPETDKIVIGNDVTVHYGVPKVLQRFVRVTIHGVVGRLYFEEVTAQDDCAQICHYHEIVSYKMLAAQAAQEAAAAEAKVRELQAAHEAKLAELAAASSEQLAALQSQLAQLEAARQVETERLQVELQEAEAAKLVVVEAAKETAELTASETVVSTEPNEQ